MGDAFYRDVVRFDDLDVDFYALPAENVRPAFEALRALLDERGWRISFPVEVRWAAADDRWRALALYGLDGTTLRVADTPDNVAHHTAASEAR